MICLSILRSYINDLYLPFRSGGGAVPGETPGTAPLYILLVYNIVLLCIDQKPDLAGLTVRVVPIPPRFYKYCFSQRTWTSLRPVHTAGPSPTMSLADLLCVSCKRYLFGTPRQCDCGDRLCGKCYEKLKNKR